MCDVVLDSSGGLQPRIQLFRAVYRYTADTLRIAPLAEVYSSTAVYSIQLYSGLQYTAVYIPPQRERYRLRRERHAVAACEAL